MIPPERNESIGGSEKRQTGSSSLKCGLRVVVLQFIGQKHPAGRFVKHKEVFVLRIARNNKRAEKDLHGFAQAGLFSGVMALC